MPPGFEARVGVQLRQYERVTVFERIEEDVPPLRRGLEAIFSSWNGNETWIIRTQLPMRKFG